MKNYKLEGEKGSKPMQRMDILNIYIKSNLVYRPASPK